MVPHKKAAQKKRAARVEAEAALYRMRTPVRRVQEDKAPREETPVIRRLGPTRLQAAHFAQTRST